MSVLQAAERIQPGDTSAPELSVVVPTFNEHDNVEPLLDKLAAALRGIRYEVIFVDDDSTDGTWQLVNRLAQRLQNVRLVHRIGRRGLSSACIEGMLASSAPYMAVMDADLQHDETILPTMLAQLKRDDLDIIVGSRFVEGGSTGDFHPIRKLMSEFATGLAKVITRSNLRDPMSGFFLLRRSFFEPTARRLSGQGFKILLDLFASSEKPVNFAEVPYTFRLRQAGESKLDTLVMLEYAQLLADKTIGRYVPIRFIMFVSVGLLGVIVHLAILGVLHKTLDYGFYWSQVAATIGAMTFNFNLNNLFTYRDRRLKGRALIMGHLSFFAICSIGAIANFQIAELLFEHGIFWALAGFLGAVVGSVWNYAVSSAFTWRTKPSPT